MQSCNHNAVILPLLLVECKGPLFHSNFFSWSLSLSAFLLLFSFIFEARVTFLPSCSFLLFGDNTHDHNYVTNHRIRSCRKLSHLISLIAISAKDQFLLDFFFCCRFPCIHRNQTFFQKIHSIWHFNELCLSLNL